MSGKFSLLAAPGLIVVGVVLSGGCQANAFTVGRLTVNTAITGLLPVSGTLFPVDLSAFSPVVSAGSYLLAGGATLVLSGIASRDSGQAGIVHGSVGGKYAAPVTDAMVTKYAGNYLATGIGSITILFPSLESVFGLLWGSVDVYNTISFATLDGPVNFTGALMPASAGSQGFGGSFYTTITSSVPFSSVVLSSTGYSFEAASVVYGAALPEPGTMSTGPTQGGAEVYGMALPEPGGLAVVGVGILGLGLALGRRRVAT